MAGGGIDAAQGSFLEERLIPRQPSKPSSAK